MRPKSCATRSPSPVHAPALHKFIMIVIISFYLCYYPLAHGAISVISAIMLATPFLAGVYDPVWIRPGSGDVHVAAKLTVRNE